MHFLKIVERKDNHVSSFACTYLAKTCCDFLSSSTSSSSFICLQQIENELEMRIVIVLQVIRRLVQNNVKLIFGSFALARVAVHVIGHLVHEAVDART